MSKCVQVAERGLSFGSSRFVEPGRAPGPLAGILTAHQALAGYVPLFEDPEAEIDTALALDMTSADLRALLPASAPFGHSLKIKQVLRSAAEEAAQPRALLPKKPAWWLPGTVYARGIVEGDLRSTFVIEMEFVLVTASLLLCLKVSQLLSPTNACADGSACTALRSVDVCLWCATVLCFAMSVVTAWLCFIASLGVGTNHFARWSEDCAKRILLPAQLFVLGFTIFGVAMATRLLISELGNKTVYPVQIKWAVAGTSFVATTVGGFAFWFSIAHSTLGFTCKEVVAFQAGAVGWRLPKKDLQCEEFRQSAPYFDIASHAAEKQAP